MVKVGIVNKSNNELPKYATIGSSGMDIRANIGYVDLPEGYEIQVRSRSGLAYKQGLFVLNSPGTIDDDYTGEIGVILCNLSGEEQTINPGDRIAQLVLCKLEDKVEWDEREELGKVTERGAGGYGHTGKQ